MKIKKETQQPDWLSDPLIEKQRQLTRSYRAVAALILVLVLQGTALVFCFPLKQRVPYLVEVNHLSGMTTLLEPMNRQLLSKNRTLIRFFLQQYIKARIGYHASSDDLNHSVVRAMSDRASYSSYRAKYVNAKGGLGQSKGLLTDRTVNVDRISFPYPEMAEIRYSTEEVNRESQRAENKHYWIALVKYAFARSELNLGDRERYNPLGFFVTDFQTQQVK